MNEQKLFNKPLVTVITVVYNDVNNIEETIKSVIHSQYENIEYIVIDGNSTDGTLNIIKQYDKYITTWISEPDHGIYDAMNKGLIIANKDSYIIWINSGDKISSFNDFINNYNCDSDIFFFSVMQNYITNKVWKINTIYNIDEKNIIFTGIHHQGFLIRKSVIDRLYRCEIGQLADLDFMMYYINKKELKKTFLNNCYISEYTLDGESDSNFKSRIISYLKLFELNNLNIYLVIMYNFNKILKISIKLIIPKKIIRYIRDVRNRFH